MFRAHWKSALAVMLISAFNCAHMQLDNFDRFGTLPGGTIPTQEHFVVRVPRPGIPGIPFLGTGGVPLGPHGVSGGFSGFRGLPRSCQDVYDQGGRKSGEKSIFLDGKSVEVYCEMEVDGGGWTVIQRRSGEFFNRNWTNYVHGFGNVTKDHWLGNDFIHSLTSQIDNELRIEFRDHGVLKYAKYSFFKVDDSTSNYKLHVRGFDTKSSMEDSFSSNDGMVFSTYDHGNSVCADTCKGGWWYTNSGSDCGPSGLNGLAVFTPSSQAICNLWDPETTSNTEMMIRPAK